MNLTSGRINLLGSPYMDDFNPANASTAGMVSRLFLWGHRILRRRAITGHSSSTIKVTSDAEIRVGSAKHSPTGAGVSLDHRSGWIRVHERSSPTTQHFII